MTNMLLSGAGAARTSTLDDFATLWKLDGNPNDKGPFALDLTEVNSPTYVAGQIGQAVQLVAASNQYLSHAHTTVLNSNPGGGVRTWTMGAWANPTSTATIGSIAQKAAVNRDFYFRMDAGGAPRLIFYDGTGTTTLKSLTSANTLTAGVFTYLLWGLDISGGAAAAKTFMKVGSNALEESAAFDATSHGVNTTEFRLGGDQLSGNEFPGLIDEMARWHRLLTSDEKDEAPTFDG